MQVSISLLQPHYAPRPLVENSSDLRNHFGVQLCREPPAIGEVKTQRCLVSSDVHGSVVLVESHHHGHRHSIPLLAPVIREVLRDGVPVFPVLLFLGRGPNVLLLVLLLWRLWCSRGGGGGGDSRRGGGSSTGSRDGGVGDRVSVGGGVVLSLVVVVVVVVVMVVVLPGGFHGAGGAVLA